MGSHTIQENLAQYHLCNAIDIGTSNSGAPLHSGHLVEMGFASYKWHISDAGTEGHPNRITQQFQQPFTRKVPKNDNSIKPTKNVGPLSCDEEMHLHDSALLIPLNKNGVWSPHSVT